MKLIPWTVWDAATRRPKRSGQIDEKLINTIGFNPLSERLLIGTEARLREDEIGEDDTIQALPQETVETERAARLSAAVTETDIVLEALKAKLTPGELAAAKQRLNSRTP